MELDKSSFAAIQPQPSYASAGDRNLRTLWVGAASFEERSLGSLQQLRRQAASLDRILILQYHTAVLPESSSEEKRAQNFAAVTSLARSITKRDPESVPVPAYSYGAGQRFVRRLLDSGYERIIIDVSCLTKIHTLAIAAGMAAARSDTEIWIAYAVPENYPGIGRSSRTGEGWQDIIVAPLSESARFFNENSGRGIVMIGHEADRLIIGLSEIEPAGGTIIVASSAQRPDLAEVSLRRNQRVIRQLRGMRSAHWSKKTVDLCDCAGIARVVDEEVSRASPEGAPVILFPYGPKPHLFTATYELAQRYTENGWFVYPIPLSYDASYSEGIGQLVWLQVRNG